MNPLSWARGFEHGAPVRIAHLAAENIRSELLCLLKRYAYEKREVTLASGLKSNFYVDCKQVSFRADGASALGQLFFEIMCLTEQQIERPFQACGGMALGAIPLSIALSLQAFSQKRNIDSLCVRKTPKEHGTRCSIEGSTHVKPGSSVLLVEDVITTGGSTINAAIALRDSGFLVEHVIAIVDREADGESNLKSHGLSLRTLFNLSDFNED